MFGDGSGELTAASKGVGVIVWVRNGGRGIIILDGQRSEGVAARDKRNANRRTFPEQVRATRFGASTGMGMRASAAKSPTLFGREDPIRILQGSFHSPEAMKGSAVWRPELGDEGQWCDLLVEQKKVGAGQFPACAT